MARKGSSIRKSVLGLDLSYDGGMGKMPAQKKALNKKTNLLAELNSKIIGQSHSIDKIVPYIQMHRAGLSPSDRPVGVFLLLGPSGVGKTRTIEVLAEELHGSDKSMIKINCGEFQMEHEVAKLIGCFTPNSKVLMADGSRKAIVNVMQGDYVINRMGFPGEVQQTYEYQHEGSILNIEVSGNNVPVEATPVHEFFAIKGHGVNRPKTKEARDQSKWYDPSKIERIAASKLEAGDILTYPRLKIDPSKYKEVIDLAEYTKNHPKLKTTEDKILNGNGSWINRYIKTSELARLGGYYVSDGGFGSAGKSVTFTYGFSKKEAEKDTNYQIVKVFGDRVSIGTEKRSSSNRINLHSTVIADLFKDLFGKLPQGKKIPEIYLHAPDSVVWDFLDAAFMGDGGRTVTRRLDYSTVSENLATQMEILIRRLGFITQRQLHAPPVKHPHWQPRYRIYVSGAQIERFAPNLRLISQVVDLTNTGNSGIQREAWIDDNFVYCKIKSITSKLYNGKVYDISVKGETSYVIENIGVKNSPPGYLGHRETQPMLNQQKLSSVTSEKSNLSLVLFDEIEKAAPSMQRILLGMLDKATLRLGDNSSVNFDRSMIFLTSNLGSDTMRKELNPDFGFESLADKPAREHQKEKLQAIGLAAVKRKFAPEFVNRIDAIITYEPLDDKSIKLILEQLLEGLKKHIDNRLEHRSFNIIFTDACKELLIKLGTSKEYGARELKRIILRMITQPIAAMIDQEEIEPDDTVTVDIKGDSESELDIQVTG